MIVGTRLIAKLIGPSDRGEFRQFWPRRSRDILSGGELVLENHYATGRSEFEALA